MLGILRLANGIQYDNIKLAHFFLQNIVNGDHVNAEKQADVVPY